jgi:hypothetical protein
LFNIADGEFGWSDRDRRGLQPAPFIEVNGRVLDKPRRGERTSAEVVTLFRSNHAHRGPHETVDERVGGGRLALFGVISPGAFRQQLSPIHNHKKKNTRVWVLHGGCGHRFGLYEKITIK